ncbi:MAG: FG-GAP-like repeat-containing protein [Thermoanaerobaculia bacterium]
MSYASLRPAPPAPPAPRRHHRWPRRLALLCCLVAVPAAVPAGDATVGVRDAQVIADEPGTFPLPFVIERGGDDADGVRLLVETAPGGPNPGTPGVDYVPLPPGTEVLLAPGETGGTVTVEAIGDSAPGPDETLLLRLTGAQAFAPQPRLRPTAMHYRVCCLSRALATADVNGDGDPDIITGNDNSANFSVLLSDGDGGFADAVDYPVTGEISLFSVVVAIGDATGDGFADVVATGFNATTIEVFAGDGTGTFAAPILVPLGNGDVPSAVVTADVNGDGNQDILTSDGGDNTISVLLGDGDGGFSTAESFATGAFPNGLAVAEVTGDGHLDVITSNFEGDGVSLLAGDGSGQFAAPQPLSIGADATPLSVTVADATGDGVPDIVTANQFGGGGFPPPETPGTVSVLAGDGAGGFDEAQQISLEGALGRAQEVAVGDVTADGEPDIVAARPIDNTVTLLAGDGAGGFAAPTDVPAGFGPNPIAIEDVTADGHLDVITANAVSSNVSILPGDGAGNVGFPGNHDVGQAPYSVVSVDLNHDGHPDVATANAFSNDVSVLINDGVGGFAGAVNHGVGNFPNWITHGDIDGNGDRDLITANFGGDVSVLLGDGAGGFAEAMHFSVGEGFVSPYAVAVADIDDNGHQDVATANTDGFSTHSVSVLLADGAGSFLEPMVIEGAAQTPQSIALEDVTGDGNVDILVTSFDTAEVALLAGDGAGGFDTPAHFATDVGPVFVVVSDVTTDGNLDLITLNHTAQSVSVLAGDGAGGFGVADHFAIFDVEGVPCTVNPDADCPWAWGLAVADVTGDGAPDIATANTNNNTLSVLPNDGNGEFPGFTAYDTGTQPGAVAVADVTGDGNFDIITSNRENHNISVHANLLVRVDLVDDEALGVIITDPRPLMFFPASLDLGEVEVGTSGAPQLAELQNTGEVDAVGLEFQMLGGDFDADTGDCGTTLPAGATCQVAVTFSPSAGGPATATLTVSSDQAEVAGLFLGGYGYGEGIVTPVGLAADFSVLDSDGNGVFEPGELVEVAPAWRNDDLDDAALTGEASQFGGPDGASYTLALDDADYGVLGFGEIGSCAETGVCYRLGVDDPAVRPATHWEAAFVETLSDDTTQSWILHIGDSFTDVPRTSLFYPAIETLLHHGVTSGCTGTGYCPAGSVTRAQMPVFVLKALEGPDYLPPACEEGDAVFTDVPFDDPFCPWIEELANRGVVAGCGSGAYCPASPVTRDQMAVFLLKTFEGGGFAPPACTGTFADVPCPSLFAAWVEELFERGITAGCAGEPLTYCPAAAANRGQMAAFITRTFGLELYGP